MHTHMIVFVCVCVYVCVRAPEQVCVCVRVCVCVQYLPVSRSLFSLFLSNTQTLSPCLPFPLCLHMYIPAKRSCAIVQTRVASATDFELRTGEEKRDARVGVTDDAPDTTFASRCSPGTVQLFTFAQGQACHGLTPILAEASWKHARGIFC